MIVIPVILIMIVAGLLYVSYIHIYDLPEDLLDENRDKPMWAQHSIEEYLNHFQYSQDSLEQDQSHEEKLQEEFLDGGFYSCITKNNKVITSNFTDEVEQQIRKMGIGTALSDPIIIQTGSHLLIRDSVQKDQNIITVTVFNPEFQMKQVDWLEQMIIVGTYVVILFILSLIIIALTNTIVSIKLSKKITEPLDLLNYGAEQIKNGNLDFEIHYDSKDELGRAIANFDEMRARLHQSIQSQLEYEEERKEIVAGISHDLRTPLTTIKGYIKGLIDGIANTPEKQQQYHHIIFNKACQMDALVDNLFLFSKLDTGHLPFYFDKVDCNEYMDKLADYLKSDFETKGLKIFYENNCPANTLLRIDSDQMRRVFVNILENSAKYKMKKLGNVNLDVSINGAYVDIEISDDGDGVPEEIIPNLFKSFYRGDESRTNSNGSSGLGLSIADRIIKAHNGTISAQNKNGLAITIKLPVMEGE